MYYLPFKVRKKGDVNLVDGKRDFDTKVEIEHLHFVARSISKHICRSCLSFLRQRANQRKKLPNFCPEQPHLLSEQGFAIFSSSGRLLNLQVLPNYRWVSLNTM